MNKLTDNIDKARAASRERLESARDIATESTAAAREKMSESKARAAALLGEGREKAAERVAATKDVAKKAAAKSEETITNSPLAIVAGGAALGVLIGALLPKSKAEGKYVGAAGRKINETAKTAYEAAKDASRDQISEMGLTNDNMREQFKDMFGKAIEAAKTAMAAAQDAVKEEHQGKK
ncbi:hypothetical protein [Sphingorhabdus sp. 109]|jgi:ElaB/YqjD/DUF883 family membrane-anchored ribosome-binding protein|uniref:hypothetical protein n=1 Tax=Sphingorhabdus sp. 109 TaxID=2653173 RepID=UPI0012EF7038|nr:hypothetical protein [Sphingorhabdus sp. 109]VWX56860.1 conserved hypothetical protein [Sphingorhabdus sp. 109]